MCGCRKNKGVQAPPAARTPGEAVQRAKSSGSVQMYDVLDGSGALVASYTNPVASRAEARRVGGTSVPRGTGSTAPATAGAAT